MLSIKFTDGTLLKEPDLDWNSIPNNVVIRYLDYKIGNQTIRLMGYERYLRLKEMVKGVNISFSGMSKVILFGQNGSICDRVTIDLINNKIKKEQVLFTEAYNGQPINDRFWKAGQILDESKVVLIKNT
jgi:hypothetical protein